MRAITLLFILAISLNSITSWPNGEYTKYKDSVYDFYLNRDRPLTIRSVNIGHIIHLVAYLRVANFPI